MKNTLYFLVKMETFQEKEFKFHWGSSQGFEASDCRSFTQCEVALLYVCAWILNNEGGLPQSNRISILGVSFETNSSFIVILLLVLQWVVAAKLLPRVIPISKQLPIHKQFHEAVPSTYTNIFHFKIYDTLKCNTNTATIHSFVRKTKYSIDKQYNVKVMCNTVTLSRLSFEWSYTGFYPRTSGKVRTTLCSKMQQFHMKERLSSFHLNGHTPGFHPQT